MQNTCLYPVKKVRSVFMMFIKGLILSNVLPCAAFAADEKARKVIGSSRATIEGSQSVTEVALALALIVAVIFGLGMATLLTLVVVPVLCSLAYSARKRFGGK